jgi:sugar phosphate isomerase/epimerase
MSEIGIAISADASRIDGDQQVLKQELDYYLRLGFTHVELSPHGCGVMFDGRLHSALMIDLLALLSQYRFQYTVHGPNPMNLMDLDEVELQYRMFVSTIEFTAAIGAGVMVYHAGRYMPEEDFLMDQGKLLMPSKKEKMWNQEIKILQEMAVLAASNGVTIAVENARPYLDASPYSYGEFPGNLAAMIEAVGHPSVGVALDVGHAFLAARHYDFDFLNSVEMIAPYVRHVHLHDNFGRACASYEKKQYEMCASGRGDMHLPIGWGIIPAAEILQRLGDYQGVITLEMRPRYRPYFGEALENARGLLESAGFNRNITPEVYQNVG